MNEDPLIPQVRNPNVSLLSPTFWCFVWLKWEGKLIPESWR